MRDSPLVRGPLKTTVGLLLAGVVWLSLSAAGLKNYEF